MTNTAGIDATSAERGNEAMTLSGCQGACDVADAHHGRFVLLAKLLQALFVLCQSRLQRALVLHQRINLQQRKRTRTASSTTLSRNPRPLLQKTTHIVFLYKMVFSMSKSGVQGALRNLLAIEKALLETPEKQV